jgi:hypothetical protein
MAGSRGNKNAVGNEFNTDEFRYESDLLGYITSNINKFCIDVLNDKLKSFESDKPIIDNVRKQHSKRIDLFVICENNSYIIELKNPKYESENRQAIGQLLDYGRFSPDSLLLLITTKYDLSTAKTIKHYNLPIRYIYFEKSRIIEYIGEEENGKTT